MDYKKFDNSIYLRLDRNDKVIENILFVCKKENILSAVFSGIGGCSEVTVATLIPAKNEFLPHKKSGLLEMISLNGNIALDENNNISEHSHALFSYLDDNENLQFIGGHMIEAVVSYTAEIKIEPVKNGIIRKKFDSELKIPVWTFS